MPAARARQIVLAACDRHRLKRLERSQTAPWRQVLRARIVLLAAAGSPTKGLLAVWASRWTPPASGAAGSPPTGWRAWPIASGQGGRPASRPCRRFPNAVMIHTPTHASWVNQAEIYFSVVQRKVVSPNDFTHLDQVRQRLADFEPRYNATARPFRWKFTPADLDDLLARIDRHQQQTTASTIPQAA